MPQNTLLLKVAKEINIGKDTIVEFLVSRGYNVENKGTTKLTGEMVDLVYNQFQKEIHTAEKQRQKFQEVKKIQSTISHSSKPTSLNKEEDGGASIFESVQPAENKAVSASTEDIRTDMMPPLSNSTIAESNIEPILSDNKQLTEEALVDKPPFPLTERVDTSTEDDLEKEITHKESKITVMSAEDVEIASIPQVNTVIKLEENATPKDKGKHGSAITERKKQKNEANKALKEKEEKISIKTNKKSSKSKKTETAKSDENKTETIASNEENKKKKKRKPKKADAQPEGNQTPIAPVAVTRLIPEKPRPRKITEIEVVNNKVELPNYTGLTILGKIDIRKAKNPASEQSNSTADNHHGQSQQQNRTLRSRRKDKDHDAKRHPNSDNNDRKPFDKNYKNYKNFKDNKYNKDNKDNKDFQARDNNYRDNRNKDNKQTEYQSRFVDRRETPKFDNDAIGDNRQSKQKYALDYTTSRQTDRKSFSHNAPPKGERVGDKIGIYEDKKKKRKTLHETYSEADIKKVMRATLVEMDDTSTGNKKTKIKMKKKAEREEKEAKQQAIIDQESKMLKLTEFVTTSDLAALLNVKAADIMTMCFNLGLMVTINQRLDKETITLIVADYGLEAEFIEATADDIVADVIDNEDDLVPRPPIITVMGHVDHGKTSLLDYIKNSNVVAGEAGGITQHIGAYHVVLKNKKSITFLDTPGHEAFTAMRARGAQVTDIVVIVVAADDSVMPQTIEAISHARAANVPIIVAINKIDKAEANSDKIKQQLSEQGILVEDWGGKYQCVEISAKKGINIDTLLDKILLEAEMLELRANPKRKAQGIIIEANEKKGLGFVATVVIQNGTLFLRDNFVAGAHYGKVRALLDERFRKVEDVLPAQPATVVGFAGLPEAGDTFIILESETEAREIAEKRAQLRREQKMRKVRLTTLDDISAQISIGGVKDLNLVIKGDAAGSVEALSDSLLKLSTEEVRVNIVLKAAGNISESDVMLAAASNAIMIGFNVSSTPQATKLSEQEDVEIRRYNIIYDCINEIHLALEGMLKPDIKEEIAATVEVRQIFKISRIGQIAGCYVASGKVTRNDKVRIIRDGFPIFNGTITSLKRNKDDAKEVDSGYECGIQISSFNSFLEGDIIEALRYVEIKRTLDIK